MTSFSATSDAGDDWLCRMKVVSGRAIERARQAQNLTQAEVARAIEMSARWLREIEGGNPSSRVEDHLRCARHLEVPLGPWLFPLLFLSRGHIYPITSAAFDTVALEQRCVDIISDGLDTMRRIYRPALSRELAHPHGRL